MTSFYTVNEEPFTNNTIPILRRGAQRAITLAVTGGLTLLGCSDKAEREYSVPTSVCETSLSAELLSPLLPPGEKVSEKFLSPADGVERCQVLVDGKITLVVSREWWSDKPSLSDIAQGQAWVELEHVSKNGKYIHSERGAVGKAECVKPIRPGNELFTVVQVPEPGRADADAVKKLIMEYTKTMSSSEQCSREG